MITVRHLSKITALSVRHASNKVQMITRSKPSVVGDYHNMPQRFIDRHTKFIKVRRPRLPQYQVKTERYKANAYYDIWRPWEPEFTKLNQEGMRVMKIFVEPIRDWSYYRGDRVEILKGPDKGKQGYVNYIVKERNWVFVEGLNLERTDGMGIVTCRGKPLLINHEVKLVDPSDLEPTEIEWRVDGNGDCVRVSTRTERVIPIPKQAYETYDYTDKSDYKDQSKDTPKAEANKVTFVPQVKTFEMDICEEMGIKEDRTPYPMYWY